MTMKQYTTSKQVKAAQIVEVQALEDDHSLIFDEAGETGVLLSSLGNASAGVPEVGDYVVDYQRPDGSNAYLAWCPKAVFEESIGGTPVELPVKVTMDRILDSIVEERYYRLDGTLTVCVLTLANGFTVTGESACVDPAEFNQEVGAQIAKTNAIDKIWPLEGYLLQQRRFESSDALGNATDEAIARICHEVNRAYCLALGDESQPAWDEAPAWQRESAINGVAFHRANPDAGADASHKSWADEKVAAGWVYGDTKDPEAKTHPCLVGFDQLPKEQQAKDYLFRGVVHALLA